MVGFKAQVNEAETALKNCPGKINLVENEAGKFTGEVIIKVNSEEDKRDILNLTFPGEYGNISMREVGLDIYYKLVKKTENEASGRNVYIRIKGMEWSATEEDLRKFLSSCSIVEILMTKTPTGRPTGEAYLQLETEADTQLAKVSKLSYQNWCVLSTTSSLGSVSSFKLTRAKARTQTEPECVLKRL